ncbi:MAG: anti-sigma factor [Pedobacter sp.]|nr:MAG: anti-sigma factor [Pedobacter sp.]
MEEGKAYIESGILELYVLGQLNATEQAEVRSMATQYPEIEQEIEAIEIAMEKYALQQAIQPAEGLEQKIFQQIGITSASESVREAVVIPLNSQDSNNYQSKIRTLRIALVACVALLVVSIAALYSAHSDLGIARDQIATLSLDREQFSRAVSFMKSNNEDLNKLVNMSDDPDWKTVRLAGQKDPNDNMLVYWHAKGKHVMVNNTKMALPTNDKDHQYQLWALVDGKPVDLGVFDVKPDSAHILVKMKEIGSAQAFAVTLEKRGGSPTPTMEQMMVMGGV